MSFSSQTEKGRPEDPPSFLFLYLSVYHFGRDAASARFSTAWSMTNTDRPDTL